MKEWTVGLRGQAFTLDDIERELLKATTEKEMARKGVAMAAIKLEYAKKEYQTAFERFDDAAKWVDELRDGEAVLHHEEERRRKEKEK